MVEALSKLIPLVTLSGETIMTRYLNFAAFAALVFFSTLPALAQEKTISLGAGLHDAFDEADAMDFRLEYRHDRMLILQTRPYMGVEVTSDGAVYANAGLFGDIPLSPEWTLTPSLGAGFYGEGSEGKDLGHVVEFRAQAEIGYNFMNGSRVSGAIGHTSNFGLGEDNPGAGNVGMYYHVPLRWVVGN